MAKSDYTAHLSAHTPAGSTYWTESGFRLEMDRIFYRNWLCVGRSEQLREVGSYLTRSVGDENVVVLRNTQSQLRGFLNFCQHRGTRLLESPEGTGLKSITCPYHAWTYSLDGRLIGAAQTKNLKGFDKSAVGLHPVQTEEMGGFVFVNFAGRPAPLARSVGSLFEQFAHLRLAELRLGARNVYEVEANWKIVGENYSECYHCAPVHPALNRVTPYFTGDNDAYFPGYNGSRGRFAGGYMTFAKDYTSMTTTGYTTRPPIRGMTAEDRKRIYYYTVFPNFLFSLHPDYLMIHRVWPVSPTQSTVENEFYFEPTTMAAPGFDPRDAVDMWDEINRQDWAVCEGAQRGTRSSHWKGGRYAEHEQLVCDFDRFVRLELGRSKRTAR